MALTSLPADPPPAGDARPVLVNMQDLALAIGTSRQSLSLWVKKWPDFPIEQRGSHGLPYLFNVEHVVAFLRAKKADAARAGAERDEALAQLILPLAEPEPVSRGPLSIKDQIEAIRLARLHREEAERLGQLVSADALRTALTTALANWQRDQRTAIRRAAERLNLPAEIARQVQDELDNAQRLFVAALRDQLGALDAA